MAKANKNNQTQQQGGSNMNTNLKVLSNQIKEVKTVGSNECDVEIAGAIVDGAVKEAEIEAKKVESLTKANNEHALKMAEMEERKEKIKQHIMKEIKELELKNSQDLEKYKLELNTRVKKYEAGERVLKALGTVAGFTTYFVFANKNANSHDEF
jgi:hypothetical protein